MRGRTETFLLALSAYVALLLAATAPAGAEDRAYEQVSPPNKYGNDAGALRGFSIYAWATADGNRLLYPSRGPMGEVHRGIQTFTIGRRSPAGWTSDSALPGGSQERIQYVSYPPRFLLPSTDLSHLVFSSASSYVPENPESFNGSGAIYRASTEDEVVEWLSKPLIADPEPPPGEIGVEALQPLGASEDLGTVYFAAHATLVPEDSERDPGTWGVYEYSPAGLRSAGVLPDGSLDPGGATPPNTATAGLRTGITSSDDAAGQVSADGRTMYFLSPDPAVGAPQLYVRRDGEPRLVSHTEAGDEAPSGAATVAPPTALSSDTLGQYVFGSADGSVAYFHSVDALTADAPDDGSVKTYRYEVASDSVTFLPGVGGPIAAASDDGERFLFAGPSIAVWDHGTIRALASGSAPLAPARATASGSAFVFSTSAQVPGFDGDGQTQIYRYDLAREQTECVSCPPAGVPAAGPARLSSEASDGHVRPSRGISADGRLVFFDTPAPLVPADTNGRRDVYEWTEGGGATLISPGTGEADAVFLDNSASGSDVFFATSEGLVAGDTDGAFDAYDARVGGGFPVSEVEACAGEACLGPAAPPPSFESLATRARRGSGNLPAGRGLRVVGWRLFERRLQLTVRIPGPGRLRATGGSVHPAARRFERGGRHRLLLDLRGRASELRREGRAAFRVRLAFGGASGRRVETGVTVRTGT